jgi:hypothetical protein
MPSVAPADLPTIEITTARREAERNWSRNLQVLRAIQPTVARQLEQVELDVEWVFARDGSLSGMTAAGKWWGGCSVPVLAGRSILQSLEKSPIGSCLLDPPHAGLVRAARERMGDCPVLFVVQPNLEVARMILCCHDFSDQFASHRLWTLCGEDWQTISRQIFDDYPGLATPARFIRTKWTADEAITSMIADAQDVFSTVLNTRAQEVSNRQSGTAQTQDRRKILLVGGSAFRLWENAADVLHQRLSAIGSAHQLDLRRFDTDDALNGSPLALLQAAGACGSVVSADLCRADCNQLVPREMPWITWITLPAVPTFDQAGPNDALVLADVNWQPLARKAGWPGDRVKTCGWPIQAEVRTTGQSNGLAIICDTRAIDIPASVKSFSSHRLLWELIEEELQTNPLAVENADDYLTNRAGQLHIGIDALDRRSFIDGLIHPAYQQGLARLLIAEKLPVFLYGRGWDELCEFSSNYRGRISTAAELETAIGSAAALVYCWPERSAHPIESSGKPIVHRSGRDRNQLIRSAKASLQQATHPKMQTSALGESILSLIHTTA